MQRILFDMAKNGLFTGDSMALIRSETDEDSFKNILNMNHVFIVKFSSTT